MKIKKTILILIALVSTALMLIGLAGCGGSTSAPSVSSAPTHWWAKSFGGVGDDEALSIQQTSNGEYIVVGETNSSGAGSLDFWIMKLNSSGTITWQKTYGGTGYDQASSVQQTSDGGYIVAGSTGSFGAGGEDFWVIKLDSSGAITWQKTYGGTGHDIAYSIQQTSDGGYIVAGKTVSFGAGIYDFLVMKLDSTGAITWQKTYGGTGDDVARSILQTSDGGYIVAGRVDSFSTGDYDYDFWVIKLDSTGAITWQKTYGGVVGGDAAYSVQQTSDGGYIVAGGNWSSGFNSDFWVIKLDSSGNIVWQKIYGAGRESAYSVQQTSDGGYIVAGTTTVAFDTGIDFWVIKLDSTGAITWQKTYGGTGVDSASSIHQTSDSGYIVAGWTDSFGAGGEDFWVLRLRSDGTISPTAPSYIGADTSATVQDTSVIPSDTSVIPIDSTATVTDTTVIGVDTNATVETQASN